MNPAKGSRPKQVRKKRTRKKAVPRFRTVLNEEAERGPFRVFLIHGRSDEWKKVKRCIQRMRFDTQVLVESFTGQTLLAKVRNAHWHDCDCAVAILSADDQLIDSKHHARPNVLFEIGYSMGFFDYRYWEENDIEPVIMLIEDKTEIPSDLLGVEHLRYSYNRNGGVESTFKRLREALNNIYGKVTDYFRP